MSIKSETGYITRSKPRGFQHENSRTFDVFGALKDIKHFSDISVLDVIDFIRLVTKTILKMDSSLLGWERIKKKKKRKKMDSQRYIIKQRFLSTLQRPRHSFFLAFPPDSFSFYLVHSYETYSRALETFEMEVVYQGCFAIRPGTCQCPGL